jgi:hypothetical protein
MGTSLTVYFSRVVIGPADVESAVAAAGAAVVG